MNIDAIIKRANKLIDKAKNKLHSSKVYLVDNEADITSLSGLVLILHPETSKMPRISTQASQDNSGEV